MLWIHNRNTAEELDVITSEKSQKTKTNKDDIMDYNDKVEIDVTLKRNHLPRKITHQQRKILLKQKPKERRYNQ